MHLVEREGNGGHSDQDVEEVEHQLGLSVQGQREERRGGRRADHPHLPLPQTIELVKGLPASLCQIKGLSFPRWASRKNTRNNM